MFDRATELARKHGNPDQEAYSSERQGHGARAAGPI
jgi:hypothetical protein